MFESLPHSADAKSRLTAPEAEALLEGMLKSDSPYGLAPEEKQSRLLPLLQQQMFQGTLHHPGWANFLRHQQPCLEDCRSLAELPILPVGSFKCEPPLSFVPPKEIKRVLRSSATTGEIPSQIAIDKATSKWMQRGLSRIVADTIGSQRRPYLVVDAPQTSTNSTQLGARGAAIQGLLSFASQTTFALRQDERGELKLDEGDLLAFAEAHRAEPVLIYGFTFILWQQLAEKLCGRGLRLELEKAIVLHSGGWKKLQDQAVDKQRFNRKLAEVLGCSPEAIVDFYGMVENVGVIYPDCPSGNKHAPAFGEVILRDPLDMTPVTLPGGKGFVQVLSALAGSFPGQSLLTEDFGELVALDGCPCGRRGIAFRFAGRAPKTEVRGCGNTYAHRSSPEAIG